jgi:hypothetical protein
MNWRLRNFLSHCDLESGAIIFHEKFAAIDGLKDRYFIVIRNVSPIVECFTTTTRLHAETTPKLASEFCEIVTGECCLPKRCFVDFRTIHSFDDIVLGSRLRSKSVKYLGDMPIEVIERVRSALDKCRSVTPVDKERLLGALDDILKRSRN